jgi:flavin reductase (DIM6/NTAB) family NADH-FMN oxidoreductase RutF
VDDQRSRGAQTTMRSFVPGDLAPRDAYNLMLSVIIPRPIGWISTIGVDGTLNLAPYSFFNGVNGSPPMVMFSAARRRSGEIKDTLRNAQETGEFVVNIVDETLAEAMNVTSGEWAYEVDEFALAKLETASSIDVRPPRVAAAPAAMEARVHQIVPVEGTRSTIVIGQVLRYHIRADVLRDSGWVDGARLKPVARMGGDEYGTLGRVFSMRRPEVK